MVQVVNSLFQTCYNKLAAGKLANTVCLIVTTCEQTYYNLFAVHNPIPFAWIKYVVPPPPPPRKPGIPELRSPACQPSCVNAFPCLPI